MPHKTIRTPEEEKRRKRLIDEAEPADEGRQGVIGGKKGNVIIPETESSGLKRAEAAQSAQALSSFQLRKENEKLAREGRKRIGDIKNVIGGAVPPTEPTELEGGQSLASAEDLGVSRLITPEEQAGGLTQNDINEGLTLSSIGGVTPVTPDDIVTAGSLLTGTGLVKLGGKAGFTKLLAKANLVKLEKEVVKKGVTKTGLGTKALKALNNKLFAGFILGTVGSKLLSSFVSQGSAIIRSSDTAMSQLREDVTLISSVSSRMPGNPQWASLALGRYDDMEVELRRLEEVIQLSKVKSFEARFNPEFTTSMQLRADKIRDAIDDGRILVITNLAKAPTTEQEELALAISELNEEGIDFQNVFSILENP